MCNGTKPCEICTHGTCAILQKLHMLYTTCNCDRMIIEPQHEISNNVVCATSKGSDRPAH